MDGFPGPSQNFSELQCSLTSSYTILLPSACPFIDARPALWSKDPTYTCLAQSSPPIFCTSTSVLVSISQTIGTEKKVFPLLP